MSSRKFSNGVDVLVRTDEAEKALRIIQGISEFSKDFHD